MNTRLTSALDRPRRKNTPEFFRYLLASFIALGVDLAFFSVGIRAIGLSWPVAAALGFFLGVCTAYFLSIRFVFLKRKFSRAPLGEFLVFFTVGVIGLGLTQLILWIGIELLKLNPEVSKLAAASVTFFFNFVVRKIALFSAPRISSI